MSSFLIKNLLYMTHYDKGEVLIVETHIYLNPNETIK